MKEGTSEGIVVVAETMAPVNVRVRETAQLAGQLALDRAARIARMAGVSQPDPATLEANAKRAAAEADVVAAARRSQAEIRRHVDAYLKEHLEPIVADVTRSVVAAINESVVKGIAGLEESQQIALDRMAANVRRGASAFHRAAWEKPKATRAAKKGKRRA